MTIFHNKIINLPVYLMNKKIGAVKNIIIDPERGLFLYVETGNNKYIKSEDIENISNNKIILKNKNKIIDEFLGGLKIIKLKVQTESGEFLGRVSDFEINIDFNRLTRLYVSGGNIIKKLIRGELIINKDQIISIKPEKIIVKDIIARKKQRNKILPEKKEFVGVNYYIKVI